MLIIIRHTKPDCVDLYQDESDDEEFQPGEGEEADESFDAGEEAEGEGKNSIVCVFDF